MTFLVLGILLFLLVASDIVKTTLSMRGGGMITNRVSRLLWRLFFLASGRKGESKLLEYTGQCVLLCVLLSWIACLWLSLFLMLASDPWSVVNGTTKAPADLWQMAYYAGYTLSTLGVGDYVAASDGWRIVTSAAAFCGLTFITMAITYIVPVLSAVSVQRQLSIQVTGMGGTPQQILLNSWNGEDFSAFYDSATDLAQTLVEHTLNYHAYPVVHCFHDSNPDKSMIPAIARLDETLWLLSEIDADKPQSRLKHKQLESAIDRHLALLQANFALRTSFDDARPEIDLDALRQAGIRFRHGTSEQDASRAKRRSLLRGLMASDGWNWSTVYGNGGGAGQA